MKYPFLLLFISMACFSCSDNNNQAGDKPTEADVIKAMKSKLEYTSTAGDVFKIDINDIKIRSSKKADLKQELQDIPKGTTVTNVDVDYTYSGSISIRKKSTLWVYKNELGEWKFKTGSAE